MKIFTVRNTQQYLKIYLFDHVVFYKKKIPLENNQSCSSESDEPLRIENWGVIPDNDKCIILGNGPSCKELIDNHYDKIKNMIKFAMNFSMVSDYYFKIKPDFHIFMDPTCIDESSKPIHYDKINMLNQVDWSLTILLPSYFGKNNFITETIKNDNIKFLFINTEHNDIMKFSDYAFKKWSSNELCPRVQNVVISAIYFSINIGIKDIFLTGVEHNFFNNLIMGEDNILYVNTNSHFYDKLDNKNYKPQYHHDRKSTFTIAEYMNAMYLTFNGYDMLKEYAEYMECNIYNLTLTSFIDSFPKIKW